MDVSHGSVTAGRSARRGRCSPALVVAVLVSAAAHLPSALLQGRAHAAAAPAPPAADVVMLFDAPPAAVDPPRAAPRDLATAGAHTRAATNVAHAPAQRGPSDSPELDLDALFPIASTGGAGGAGGAGGGGGAGRAGAEPVDVGRAAPVVAPPVVAAASARGTPPRALAREWSCPFPEEADGEDVHAAVATVEVDVAADGSVTGVRVLVDPGGGFGRAARRCASRQRFAPAKDPAGVAAAGTTTPIRVRFAR